LFNKKVLVTVHGLDWQRDKWSKFAKLYLKFGEYIIGRSKNKIISVSSNLKSYFITKYGRKEEDIFFVPNGVEVNDKMAPKAIREFGLESNEYLLFLARLVPEKGAHYLIKAYNKINTLKKLVIAGGSSFTDDYLHRLKLLANGNENIIFTGNVSGRLLQELYSNCYLYILPSDIEGMPLTLLEAMSYGKKCLVSNIPENKDVILDGVYGSLFNKSDVDDLAAKLEYELTNKEINNKSEEIIAYITSHYDWNEVARKTLDIYREVAASSKG
jgi:glycosyltransferase involved in cell wall biosynthesis